jgi:hypothetical protein
MAVEAVNEYIEVSENCLNTKKPDGGCGGYPLRSCSFALQTPLASIFAATTFGSTGVIKPW